MSHRRKFRAQQCKVKFEKAELAVKCEKTGKISYQDEKKANADKMRMWAGRNMSIEEFIDLHIYDCEYCKMKHIGHKSYFRRKLIVDE